MAQEFVEADLAGARFVRCDLRGAVLRGVDIAGTEIESPWLLEGGATLMVNGVDVAPYVDAELDRRFPGRELRRAQTPEDLRAAWAALESTWAATLARVAAMPARTVDECVDGEWSFAQTLRHLVFATDAWLRRAVLGIDQPFHPLGQTIPESAEDGLDLSLFVSGIPPYDDVLAARAERVAMVRDYLAEVTDEVLGQERPNPWAPEHAETVLSCLGTILEEEWEHHRYAVRDLDAISARDGRK
jgi:hypothetical protein